MLAMVACSIKYSFTGASIAPNVKSYTIANFANRARNVNPTLSEYIVEQLRNKINRQTNLDYNENTGDLEFEGTITGYEVMPLSVREENQDAQNRLTVTITVKFTNNKNHELDFEQEFKAYADFSSANNFADVEESLVKITVEQIINDIFNKSFSNW
jgi:hypothetical protein